MMKNLFLKSGLMALLFAGLQSVSQGDVGAPVAKQMTVNDVTLPYIEQGQGAPVVFVHGAFSDLRAWEPQREAVARRFRFIAYTQRYFGTDPWPDQGEHYSQVTHAADLAAFIRQLNVGPVYLVGRSYGGTVAVRTALQHPELVRAVFVQEPSIAASAVADPDAQGILKKERGGMAPAREAAKAGKADEATHLFADWTNGQPGGFDTLPPETRSMHLDNGRTVALHFAAAPPPTGRKGEFGVFVSRHTAGFLVTGRSTAHSRPDLLRTPPAALAELCELVFRQVSECSSRSDDCLLESSNSGSWPTAGAQIWPHQLRLKDRCCQTPFRFKANTRRNPGGHLHLRRRPNNKR
jgi:pimeloyl-ACP methyl ester carboxylesterase